MTQKLTKEFKAILNKPCVRCGKACDLMVGFTNYQVCGRCTRKEHAKAVKA